MMWRRGVILLYKWKIFKDRNHYIPSRGWLLSSRSGLLLCLWGGNISPGGLDFLRGVRDKPPVNAWHNDMAPRWHHLIRLSQQPNAQAAKSPFGKRAMIRRFKFRGPREWAFGSLELVLHTTVEASLFHPYECRNIGPCGIRKGFNQCRFD